MYHILSLIGFIRTFTVLPNACRNRVSVEAGITDYWRKYIGLDGKSLGVDTFGESAPADKLFEHFGFTSENIVAQALRLLEND